VSFDITVSGAAAEAVSRVVPQLVSDLVASRITGQDASLWGEAAEEEAAKRLGWTEAVVVSEGLVDDILALRDELRDAVSTTSCSLAWAARPSPRRSSPGRPACPHSARLDPSGAGGGRPGRSPRDERSGGVVEVGIDGRDRQPEAGLRACVPGRRNRPDHRIVIVTDPGSPLDVSARADGYRVFNADPNVGGRYSALTAFGLVPVRSRRCGHRRAAR
jgi:glucose-6-phosphate isomerase